MNANYTPVGPLLRCLFAVAALSATLTCGRFIDWLAHSQTSGSVLEAAVQSVKASS
jgi:hypothetical protein